MSVSFRRVQTYTTTPSLAAEPSGDYRVVIAASTHPIGAVRTFAAGTGTELSDPFVTAGGLGNVNSIAVDTTGKIAALGCPYGIPAQLPGMDSLLSTQEQRDEAAVLREQKIGAGSVAIVGRTSLRDVFRPIGVHSATPPNSGHELRNYDPKGANFGIRVSADSSVSRVLASSKVVVNPDAKNLDGPMAAPAIVARDNFRTPNTPVLQFGGFFSNADDTHSYCAVSQDGNSVAVSGNNTDLFFMTPPDHTAIGHKSIYTSFTQPTTGCNSRVYMSNPYSAQGEYFGQVDIDRDGTTVVAASLISGSAPSQASASILAYDVRQYSGNRVPADTAPIAESRVHNGILPFVRMTLRKPNTERTIASVRCSKNGSAAIGILPETGRVAVWVFDDPSRRYERQKAGDTVSPRLREFIPTLYPAWISAPGLVSPVFAPRHPPGTVSFCDDSGTNFLIAAADGTARGVHVYTAGSFTAIPPEERDGTIASYLNDGRGQPGTANSRDPDQIADAFDIAVRDFEYATAPPPVAPTSEDLFNVLLVPGANL